MLPIGVVIPTRNCASSLGYHLDSVREWVDKVAEIIVVDSESTDGTWEMLKAGLDFPHVQFHQHPPGLYASWNYGIKCVTAPYVYISTIGDTIGFDGLHHLLKILDRAKSDVIISAPEIVDTEGKHVDGQCWPVHTIIHAFESYEPGPIPDTVFFACCLYYAIVRGLNTPLGSCASNLFRKGAFHLAPFPTDYGTNGDTLWALDSAMELRFAFTTKCVSTFMIHPKNYQPNSWEQDQQSIDKLCKEVGKWFKRPGWLKSAFPDVGLRKEIQSLFKEFCEFHRLQSELKRVRTQQPLWALNPKAWELRKRRKKEGERILTQWSHFLEKAME